MLSIIFKITFVRGLCSGTLGSYSIVYDGFLDVPKRIFHDFELFSFKLVDRNKVNAIILIGISMNFIAVMNLIEKRSE
jgi:hypothetical protein